MHTGKQKQMNAIYQASLVNRHIRRFTGSLGVDIPGLQPHGESCDGRRLPKISGIREEYILEWKFQKIIF